MTPTISDSASPFWDALRNDQLKLPVCQECESAFFPPGPVCPQCHGEAVEWQTDDGYGELYSFTRQHNTAPGFEAPLVIGLVELDAGPRLLTRINDAYGELEIGDQMQITATEYDQEYDREYRDEYPFFTAVRAEKTEAET